jgi:hypothetical protein
LFVFFGNDSIDIEFLSFFDKGISLSLFDLGKLSSVFVLLGYSS